MASRHGYWVIVMDQVATAFRSKRREDLVPTLVQLQRRQPTADLRWFDRGRLWSSEEAARDAARQRPKPAGRGPGWRPGGSHVDPRARFAKTRDEKRAQFKRRQRQSGPPGQRDRGPRKAWHSGEGSGWDPARNRDRGRDRGQDRTYSQNREHGPRRDHNRNRDSGWNPDRARSWKHSPNRDRNMKRGPTGSPGANGDQGTTRDRDRGKDSDRGPKRDHGPARDRATDRPRGRRRDE
jgi:hypothetical protein